MADGYKLTYTTNGYKTEVSFREDIDVETLRYNLRYFLLSCSWLPVQVDSLLGEDE